MASPLSRTPLPPRSSSAPVMDLRSAAAIAYPAPANVVATASEPSLPTRRKLWFRKGFISGLWNDTTKASLSIGWDLFKSVAGDIPVPGLAGTLDAVSSIIDLISKHRKNRDDIEYLRGKLQTFQDIVNRYQADKIRDQFHSEDDSSYDLMCVLVKKFEDIAIKYNSENLAIIKCDVYAREIGDVLTQVNDMVSGMMFRAVLSTEGRVMKIQENQVLQDLRKALTATSDKAVGKKCHPGTCETVVSRIVSWITNPEENGSIFWLHGPPSSGKTCVVSEVIKRVDGDNAAGVVVSDFLCTRIISESGHTEDIIPTLAATLADKDRSYRKELCRYLETMTTGTQTVLNKTPPEQVKDLFITPLQKLGSMKRVLLVIDSLEECSPEHSSYQSEAEAQIRDLLEGFRVHAPSAKNLKIIISSRPTKAIMNELQIVARSNSIITSYDMTDYIKSEEARGDIEKFYREWLQTTDDEAENWLTKDLLRGLVNKTENSFLLAQTICRRAEMVPDVEKELRKYLDMRIEEIRSTSKEGIYSPILDQAVQELSQSAESLETFRQGLVTIVLLKNLMSVEDLSAILGLARPTALRKCLQGVSSIVYIPPSASFQKAAAVQRVTDDVRIHDTAFADYLRDKKTAHPKVWIDTSVQNSVIAARLLTLLTDRLRSIAKRQYFDQEYRNDPKVFVMAWDFKRNKMRETPSSAVAYASRFWMFHILESQMNWQGQLSSSDMGEHNIEIILKLKDFLDRGRILSWIEILMCIDIADEAPVQLRKLKTWLETVSLVPVRKRTSTRQSSAQQSGRSWLFSSPQTVTPDDESGPHRDPVHVQNCYAEVKRKVDGLLAYLETQEFKDDTLLRQNAARKADANEMRETPQASVRLDAIIGDNKQSPRARKLAEDLFLELGMGGETQV